MMYKECVTLKEMIKHEYEIGYLNYEEYLEQMNKYDKRLYDMNYYQVYQLIEMLNKDGKKI